MTFAPAWLRGATAMALACVSIGAAQAAPVEAKATLRPLQFTVVDLDPNDGIDAGFSFLEGTNGPIGWSAVTIRTPQVDLPHQVSTDGFQRYPQFSFVGNGGFALLSTNNSVVTAHTFGPMEGVPFSIDASSFTGFHTHQENRADWLTLTLAPHTMLTISAFATTFASAPDLCEGSMHICTSAIAESWIQGQVPLEGSTYIRSELFGLAGVRFGKPVEQAEALLSIDLVNPYAVDTTAWLSTHVEALATPIPEPQTHALMLVGLSIVGWAFRRSSSGLKSV